AVEPGTLAAAAAGPLEYDATLLVGVDRPLHACHGRTPCIIRRAWRRSGRGLGQRPSSFFAFLMSAAERTSTPARRRVRVEGLCSKLCRRLARSCRSLPDPVTLNRFLAPL